MAGAAGEVDPRDEMTSTQPEKRCAICNTPRTEHAKLLAEGELHHRFSESGELVHESLSQPQARSRRNGSDLALRMALIDAGMLRYEDLARAEVMLDAAATAAERRGSSGDSEDRRGAEAMRGGWRDPASGVGSSAPEGVGDAEPEQDSARPEPDVDVRPEDESRGRAKRPT